MPDLLDGGAAAPASAPAMSTPAAAPADTPATTVDTSTSTTTDTTTPPASAAKPSIDDTLRAAWDKLNPTQNRDSATGRFAARDASAPAADAAGAPDPAAAADGTAATATTTSTDQPAEPAPGTAQTPSTVAPNSWSAEMKAKWATVPPDVQTYVAHREAEAHQAITRAGEQIKAYEPIRNVIDKFSGTFQRNNLQPHDGIARMLAVEDMLAQDPKAAVAEIARAYGVDLAALTGQQPAAPGAGPDATAQAESPAVAAMRKELAETRAELKQVTSHLTAQQRQQLAAKQAAEQAENDALARQIADFVNEQKDGKPMRPHYHAVRQHMSALMMSGAAATLQDAYDQAVFANPDTRKLILAEQASAAETRRAEEARKKADEAKRAGAVNVRSTTAQGNNPKSVDDTLNEIARRHYQ